MIKPRCKVFWPLALVVVFGLVAWFFLRPSDDPLYQGQRVSDWFDQYSAINIAERKKAAEAFRGMGSLAIPFLVKCLHTPDANWRTTYERLYATRLQRCPSWIVGRLPAPRIEPPELMRSKAASALGLMGDAAKPAVHDLAEALSDRSLFVRFSAAQSLTALGPVAREALPAMIESLRSANVPVRGEAIVGETSFRAVVSVARDAPESIPLLLPLLAEGDEVKVRALIVLSQLGSTANPAERAIEAQLVSTDRSVRFAAVVALWELFPERHVELLPKLEEFVHSPVQHERESVGRKLIQMQPLTDHAMELLTGVVAEGSDDFCWEAFSKLSQRGREASNAVPVLIAGLDAANPRVAAKAATALGEVGVANAATLKSLEKARQHEYLMVRDAAEVAIQRIKPNLDSLEK